jgi:hypothetical protein
MVAAPTTGAGVSPHTDICRLPAASLMGSLARRLTPASRGSPFRHAPPARSHRQVNGCAVRCDKRIDDVDQKARIRRRWPHSRNHFL